VEWADGRGWGASSKVLFSGACAAVATSGREEKTGGSRTSIRLKLTWEGEGLGENSGAPLEIPAVWRPLSGGQRERVTWVPL
jgi:hypothetical protein